MKRFYRGVAPDAARIRTRTAALHLAALSSFAVALPYLDPLRKSRTFFVEHSATGLDVVVLALILLALPPLVLVAVEVLAGAVSSRLKDAVHLLFIALLVALFVWQALHDPDRVRATVAETLLPLSAGAIAALAYWRLEVVRAYTTMLSIGPPLVLVLFLSASPVKAVVFAGDGPGPVPGVTARAPVVMIVLDELPVSSLMTPERRIDRVRYPNFARLAGTATWYRNATTAADLTELAVPSLLSGRVAKHGQVPAAADHPDNLFRLLAGRYRLDVFEWETYLCSKSICPHQVGRPFVQRIRSMLGGMRDIPALPRWIARRLAGRISPSQSAVAKHASTAPTSASVRRAILLDQDARLDAFVQSLRPSNGQTLNYLHLLLPHWPWRRLPSGHRYDSVRAPWEFGYLSQWQDLRDSAVGYQRHLFQVAAFDGMLGRIVGKLKAIGLYDRALVVVTADHGVSIRALQGARNVTPGNVSEIAAVPMIVKAPNQRKGRIDDGHVETVDLLPTIARQLGVRVPWTTSGRPADQVGRTRAAVTVRRTKGGEVTIRRSTHERRLAATIRRKQALFGSGDEGPGLYALGGRPELLGRRVDDLSVRPRGRVRAALDGEHRFRSVNARAGALPAEVTGEIRGGGAPRHRRIAIALNGRIAATAWTLRAPSGEYYTAVCPASSYRAGRNVVEVFALFGRRGRTLLTRL